MRVAPLLLSALVCLVACKTAPPAGPAVQSTKPGPLFCWALERGALPPSYLLGSIHALPSNRADIDRAIDEAYRASRELVVEVDVVNIDQDEVLRTALDKGIYADDEPGLDQRLTPALWTRTSEALSKGGVPAFAAVRQRPWLVALTLGTLGVQRAGYQPEMGVDHRLLKRAHDDKKPIRELETMAMQLDLFAGLDEPTQIEMLEEALDEDDEIEASLTRLLEAWSRGDPEALRQEIEQPLRADPAAAPFFDRWLYDRNARMGEHIGRLLEDGVPRLYVVGAAHLVGEKGLLQLMRDRGFSVRQLVSAAASSTQASASP